MKNTKILVDKLKLKKFIPLLLILFTHSAFGQNDPCSGLRLQTNPSFVLERDSLLYGCSGDSLVITNSSYDTSGQNLTHSWTVFGKGTIFIKDFRDSLPAGRDSILLTITNDSGCSISQKYIYHISTVQSSIWVNDSAQCQSGNSFSFRDSSKVNLGRSLIDSVRWWIPNVLSKNEFNFTHSFAQDSFYSMRLATYVKGGCSDTSLMPLSIHASPIAGINYLTDTVTCYIPGVTDSIKMSTQIYLSNRTGASITTRKWVVDFLTSYTVDTFKYKFDPLNGNVFGAQSYKLEVTADNGCSDDSISNIYVVEPVDVAGSLKTSSVCKGAPLQLNVNTNFDSKDPARTTYLIESGDTTYFSADSLIFYKSDTGVFNWKLIQTTVGGCTDSVSSTGTVYNVPVALLSSANEIVCENAQNDTLFFADLASLSGTETRSWYINDTFKTSDSSFNYIPSYVGLSIVKLKIENTAGCADSVSVTAGKTPQPQGTIQRLSSDSCLADLQIFKAKNTGASRILKATWFFSDSTQLSDTVVSRRFSSTGAQSITLAVEDEYGCKDTSILTTNIAVSPKAKFIASAYSSCVDDQKFTFYDSSTTPAGTLGLKSWIMSDGSAISNTSASSINKVFTTGALKYSVKLSVINSFGCKDTFTDFVYVYPNPTADFSINQTSQCLTGNSFELNNLSLTNTSSPSLNYYWNFGDGSSSITKSPTKSFNNSGSYNIKLIATNPQGCRDSITYAVNVLAQPKASFTINNTSQCIDNNTFQLTQTSTATGISIIGTDWTFSDGTTRTGSTTSKTFAIAGKYNIEMKSRASNGCYDSMIQSVTVLPKPKALFSVNKDTQCYVGNAFQFSNNSSIVPGGGGLTYKWEFGDTTTSTVAHPNVSYNSYGNFAVKLTASSQYGCKDIFSLPIQVTASPKVSFNSILPFSQCNKVDTFKLNNTTNALNGKNLGFEWKMGDGNTYSGINVVHSYSSAGSYFVKLIARNSIGCVDSFEKKMVVYPDPSVNFTVNQLNQCFTSQDFQFTNASTVGFNGGTLSYQWKRGDSLFATSTNSNIKFNSEGSYPIRLISQTSNGCIDSITKTVSVLPTPIADFNINKPNQCLSTNSYKFTNNSLIQNGTLTYNWSFGDGIGSNIMEPQKVYTKSGNFTVALIAVSNKGCSDTMSRSVSVYSMPVSVINLSDSSLCLKGNSFNISQTSSNSDGSSLSYDWNFGDSTQSSGGSVKKSYKNSGQYLLRLITKTNNGCVDSFQRNIVIFNQPYAGFSANSNNQCLSGNSYTATNISQIKGNNTLNYNWNFGNSNTSSTKAPTWNYTSSGIYPVTLYVESSEGCRDTFIDTMVVFNQPNVDFSLNSTDHCLRGNIVQLTNKSTISGASLTYAWNFGDGKSSIGSDPKTIYNSAGTYNIKLIVTTSKFCKDSITKSVNIHPNPVSDYSINSPKQCLNTNKFVFNNSSVISSGSLTYNWLFGDANTDNSTSPSHIYAKTGDYIVSLASRSDKGCTDTIRKEITIWPDPEAYFEISDSIQCINDNDFKFFNYSKIESGSLQAQWNYGDGTVKNTYMGDYHYSASGLYEVTLFSESNFGCLDSMKKWVVVTNQPKVMFSINDADQCENYNKFIGTNNSTYSGTETVSYYWDISTGDRITGNNLNYSFKEYGNYQVKLVGVTSEGCKDSLSEPLYVYPQGKSGIRILDDSFCLRNNLVTIGNDSRVDGDRFAAIRWEFGDGTYNTLASLNPIKHSYNAVGIYEVLLITTTSNLCKDTSKGQIEILPMPVALMTVNETVSCFNEQKFEFTDASNPGAETWKREWIMERRVVSTDGVVNYNFTKPGELTAKLVQINGNGCTDTFTQEILVNPSPKADFTINLPEQCLENNEYFFINTSTGTNGEEGLWLPEPGVATMDINYYHQYIFDGTYDASLTVYTDSGCSDEISKRVVVHPTPQGFISKSNACVNDPITFDPNSSINSGIIQRYDWTLGDGTYTSDSSPVHKYILPNNYKLTLKMTSDKGCNYSMTDYVDVYPKPIAAVYVATERPTILKPEVEFWDSMGGNWMWEWDFGDFSAPGVGEQEFHTYEDTGNFNVRLVVSNDYGCNDTTYRVVRIWPAFKLLYPTAFSPNDDGINDDYNILGKFHSIVDAKIAVYNSVGILVYESNDIEQGWNGKYMNNGEPLPAGNYELVVSIRDVYNEQFSFTKKISIVR